MFLFHPPLKWHISVDTGAFLERTWAALCGLGWIGKNGLLINKKFGSYFFLGEVLLNYEIQQLPMIQANYCGNCCRCKTACPTQAILCDMGDEYFLDSRKCIGYWTIEKRGELNLSSDDLQRIGAWIAGCDICQEVCPFNIKTAQLKRVFEHEVDVTEFQNWKSLQEETSDQYKKRVALSALNRVKPDQFKRNLKIVLENRKKLLQKT